MVKCSFWPEWLITFCAWIWQSFYVNLNMLLHVIKSVFILSSRDPSTCYTAIMTIIQFLYVFTKICLKSAPFNRRVFVDNWTLCCCHSSFRMISIIVKIKISSLTPPFFNQFQQNGGVFFGTPCSFNHICVKHFLAPRPAIIKRAFWIASVQKLI